MYLNASRLPLCKRIDAFADEAKTMQTAIAEEAVRHIGCPRCLP